MQLSTQPEICKAVEFLADKGSELDPMDINNRTPIALAKYDSFDNAVSKSGFAPLIFAVEEGDVKSVSSLIAAGAGVNYEVPGNTNVLLIAIMAKKP
jgi:ankyrin repeat protein